MDGKENHFLENALQTANFRLLSRPESKHSFF
jgi:hypothetical protein